jgi:hypothetical protein
MIPFEALAATCVAITIRFKGATSILLYRHGVEVTAGRTGINGFPGRARLRSRQNRIGLMLSGL